jgi:hypothetical protein
MLFLCWNVIIAPNANAFSTDGICILPVAAPLACPVLIALRQYSLTRWIGGSSSLTRLYFCLTFTVEVYHELKFGVCCVTSCCENSY